MSNFQNAEIGTIGLIQQQEDGSIIQIGLTESQSKMLQLFLASISEEKSLIKMPPEYDLILKSEVCAECRSL